MFSLHGSIIIITYVAGNNISLLDIKLSCFLVGAWNKTHKTGISKPVSSTCLSERGYRNIEYADCIPCASTCPCFNNFFQNLVHQSGNPFGYDRSGFWIVFPENFSLPVDNFCDYRDHSKIIVRGNGINLTRHDRLIGPGRLSDTDSIGAQREREYGLQFCRNAHLF